MGWMPCSFDGGDVLGIFAAVEDAAVHLGMKRLDAAVEHLGEAGEFGDVFHGDAGVAEQLGGASGGDEFDAEGGELAGEVDESGFVGDGEDGAVDFSDWLTWVPYAWMKLSGTGKCTKKTSSVVGR